MQPFRHKYGKTLAQSWSLDSGLLLRPFIPSLIWLWSSQSLVGLKMTLKSSQFFLGYLDTNTLNSTRAPFSYSLRASKLGIDAKDFFYGCLFVCFKAFDISASHKLPFKVCPPLVIKIQNEARNGAQLALYLKLLLQIQIQIKIRRKYKKKGRPLLVIKIQNEASCNCAQLALYLQLLLQM